MTASASVAEIWQNAKEDASTAWEETKQVVAGVSEDAKEAYVLGKEFSVEGINKVAEKLGFEPIKAEETAESEAGVPVE